MAPSSAPDSPDPLTLPSSPLAARSSPAKPATRKGASPSQSFIMHTGPGGGDASPWRIRVTVEAEPQGGQASPSRRPGRRSELVPLHHAEAASEAEAGFGYAETGPAAAGKKAVRRKRKATPIRRRPGAKAGAVGPVEGTAAQPPATSSPTRARRRRSLNPLPPSTRPPKRLSQAREELDVALQEAVGHTPDSDASTSDRDVAARGFARGRHHVPGDMTVALDEDFTMVSVETLQSMRGGVDTSLISVRTAGRDAEGEKSGLSASHLPSSPPKQMEVTYPNLSDEVKVAEETPRMKYAEMRGQKTSGFLVAGTAGVARLAEESQAGSRREEGGVSERARATPTSAQPKAPPSQTHRARDDAPASATAPDATKDAPAAGQPSHLQSQRDEDADIWQEEASRSLQEDDDDSAPAQPPVPQHHRRRLQLQGRAPPKTQSPEPPLARPPRAKLPRTWRSTSGVHFSYSDSPEHAQPAGLVMGKRDASGSDSGGGRSRASSGGVLTPPSSVDDEVARPGREESGAGGVEQDQEEAEGSDIDLTHPDAEATHIPAAHPGEGEEEEEQEEEVASPSTDGTASPEADGDDTGLFWHHNLPTVYQRQQHRQERPRPQRRGAGKAMDLSELLALQKASSPAKPQLVSGDRGRVTALNMRPVYGRIGTTADAGAVVSSPLRRSLLRSIKVGGSPAGKIERMPEGDMVEEEEETVEESWASKASDQRQLLREQKAATPALVRTRDTHQDVEEDSPEEVSDDDEEGPEHGYLEEEDEEASYGGETSATITHHDTTRSYEEHLNLDSPQKIRVKFNDSLTGNSSILAPRQEYPPLFGVTSTSQRAQQVSASSCNRAESSHSVSPPPPPQPGVFTRLSHTLYTALIRPSGPTCILPSATPDPAFDPDLRAHLRSRYSVLPNTHPWTLTHMWTLNRMHNSVYTRASDSILPTTGPVPARLGRLIGTTQTSVSGFPFEFRREHAYMVWSFGQILVDPAVIVQMERGEVAWLGDATSATYRGIVTTGTGAQRDGREVVFWPSLRPEDGVEVESGWVVKALGEVVRCEGELREQKARDRGVGCVRGEEGSGKSRFGLAGGG